MISMIKLSKAIADERSDVFFIVIAIIKLNLLLAKYAMFGCHFQMTSRSSK